MSERPRLLSVLQGERITPYPVWFMRQAGRHLPEYLETRSKAKNFIDFCLRPDLASEATLQPIRRYDMDAAILFADILLIPMGLGRDVRFIKGKGPDLDPITPEEIRALPEMDMSAVSNIFETVKAVRGELTSDKALIGFAGGPWTVATYMIEGGGSKDREMARRFGYKYPDEMAYLLSRLADATADYLISQAKAGADALKIFESWAGGLSPWQFENWVLIPTRQIVEKIRAAGVTQPIIGFPKGAGEKILSYVGKVDVQALALGTSADPVWARKNLPPHLALQGNLDPLLLRMGGQAMEDGIRRILENTKGPHIFNLGHGVTPDVEIKSVHRAIEIIREYNYAS